MTALHPIRRIRGMLRVADRPAKDWIADHSYHDEVGRILMSIFERPFRQATREEDWYLGDDYVSDEQADAPRYVVAARMRDAKYASIYPTTLLIRAERPLSGRATELHKLIRGHGQRMLYGYRQASGEITAWILFNLDIARRFPHWRYVLLSQPKMQMRRDSLTKDLPLFSDEGRELFPGAIEASRGLFWSDATRRGRPLSATEILKTKPHHVTWGHPVQSG